tara:strand:- start:61 stop:606 length:546 start_codon:yes stop_codon:yes gene_type:complete
MLLVTILTIIGTIVGCVGAFLTITIIVAHAFKKSAPWGFYSLIPGAVWIYAILHFSEVKRPFIVNIVGTVIFFIGLLLAGLDLLAGSPASGALDSVKMFLEQNLVPMLKPTVDSFHALIDPLSPPVWRFSICAYLVLGTVWALFLSKEYVLLGSPVSSRWRDLRLWIPVLLVPYLLIYLFV